MNATAPGPIAGRYTIVRELGRGGMGTVWLARDEVLGRDVAIKRVGLFPGNQAPDLERAEREAKLAARLSHPHVVAVFDLAVDGDARWLVMEYVEGTTLSSLASERGGLPVPEAAAVIRQAADALREAHAAGIVHRDVKPSNLIVTPGGTTKLTDFGIARGAGDAALTQTGLLTGSPHYLAPEVVAGGSATPASDVWSLGATAYQALTGRPPYDLGENVVAGLARIVSTEPPRLPDAGPLRTVLESTMVHDPARRWTAEHVYAYLSGEPVQGTQPMPAPSAPTAVLPPRPAAAAAPAPQRAPERPSERPAPRRRLWPVLAAAALLLGVVLTAWLVGRSGTQDPGSAGDAAGSATSEPAPGSSADEPASSEPSDASEDDDPSEEPSEDASEETSEGEGPTADGMTQFVETYLATVTQDPDAAWDMLTPQFQEDSGGREAYRDFWEPIESASLQAIEADPDSLTVSYTVVYTGPSDRDGEDSTRLVLTYEDGQYLIASEPR